MGSSGYGEQGMNARVSSANHGYAQELLGQKGTTVQFIRIDLGTAETPSEKNNILRYYEDRELKSRRKEVS